jgi:hypothetical protein
MLSCYITFEDNHPITFDFGKLDPEDFTKVIKVVFHKLRSVELELYAPNVYNLTNLEMLVTTDLPNTNPDFSNYLGNLIHLNTLKLGHFSNYLPHISKCYQNDNRALILNLHSKIDIPTNIEYLNIFIDYIIDKQIIDYVIAFFNNLHSGLKYLQININHLIYILNFITNLPTTLEVFNIVILNCDTSIIRKNEYKNYVDTLVSKMKIPFNCIINLKFKD